MTPVESGPVTFSKLPFEQTVSVVIPCYNEERFIGKALENLAEQYPPEDYEIIVVDGMSLDQTRKVIVSRISAISS
jgi:glycosyltransferase involved in cell wall biosynthesis